MLPKMVVKVSLLFKGFLNWRFMDILRERDIFLVHVF